LAAEEVVAVVRERLQVNCTLAAISGGTLGFATT
jgi:hypothetical protein